jgi:hypothetical protein
VRKNLESLSNLQRQRHHLQLNLNLLVELFVVAVEVSDALTMQMFKYLATPRHTFHLAYVKNAFNSTLLTFQKGNYQRDSPL